MALVPVDEPHRPPTSRSALTQVVAAGAPASVRYIFRSSAMFAVANSALINMLMASRLLYGISRQRVLPHAFARILPSRRTPWVSILFTTALAFGLIIYVVRATPALAQPSR